MIHTFKVNIQDCSNDSLAQFQACLLPFLFISPSPRIPLCLWSASNWKAFPHPSINQNCTHHISFFYSSPQNDSGVTSLSGKACSPFWFKLPVLGAEGGGMFTPLAQHYLACIVVACVCCLPCYILFSTLFAFSLHF